MKVIRQVLSLAAIFAIWPVWVYAQQSYPGAEHARDTGISAIWILANFSYAGMRAQNSPSSGWRILAFLFGLPGTLLTFFVVQEGSERAYGVDVPRKQP